VARVLLRQRREELLHVEVGASCQLLGVNGAEAPLQIDHSPHDLSRVDGAVLLREEIRSMASAVQGAFPWWRASSQIRMACCSSSADSCAKRWRRYGRPANFSASPAYISFASDSILAAPWKHS
jgi:hypothetical protein